MKNQKNIDIKKFLLLVGILLVISLILVWIYRAKPFASGDQNKNSITSFKSGFNDPSNDLGANGDFYLNNSNGQLFQKINGIYQVTASVKAAEIRNGEAVPENSLGEDGDLYIDSKTGQVYKKENGTYTIIANFVGPQGPTGSQGPAGSNGTAWYTGDGLPDDSQGKNGDYYLDNTSGNVYRRTFNSYIYVSNIKGSMGDAGVTGATGVTGSTGATGATGTDGTNGVDGANGTNGSTMRNGAGAPDDSLGANGDYYINTTSGDLYLKSVGIYAVVANVKGPKGDTGIGILQRGLKVQPFSFEDMNNEITNYWHATNGVVDLWLDMGIGASTWAMDTQVGVLKKAINCWGYEPYAGNAASNPYQAGQQGGDPFPNTGEIAKHRIGNSFSFTEATRVYKDVASADSDTLTNMLNPTNMNASTNEMVIARYRRMLPFTVVPDKFPAFQLLYQGQTIGYDSLTSGEYGADDPPLESLDSGYTGGSSDNMVGMMFNWSNDYQGIYDNAQNVTFRFYVNSIVGAGAEQTYRVYVYPHRGLSNSYYETFTTGTVAGGAWNTVTIPSYRFTKGTNFIMIYGTGGTTKHITLGETSVTTQTPMKNYLISGASVLWDNPPIRYWEYYHLQKDTDQITTWVKVDKADASGAKQIKFDFIGATLGNPKRYPKNGYDFGGIGPTLFDDLYGYFDRSTKYDANPNKFISPNLGTITTATSGYEPIAANMNKPLTLNAGDTINFSRDDDYRWDMIIGATDTKPSFRLSMFNDLFAGGSGVNGTSNPWLSSTGTDVNGVGYNRGWDDFPVGATAYIYPSDANSGKTAKMTIDYTNMVNDILEQCFLIV